MWMKSTLRAEAWCGGRKEVLQTLCFQPAQMLGESQRLYGIKGIHCGCGVQPLTEIKLCPQTFYITSQGLCQ